MSENYRVSKIISHRKKYNLLSSLELYCTSNIEHRASILRERIQNLLNVIKHIFDQRLLPRVTFHTTCHIRALYPRHELYKLQKVLYQCSTNLYLFAIVYALIFSAEIFTKHFSLSLQNKKS